MLQTKSSFSQLFLSFPRRRESSAFTLLTLLFFQQPAFANDVKIFLSKQMTQIPKPQRLWIDKGKQKTIKNRFNPSQIKISYRYWQKDNKTIWVLDEIGKERNITTGIVIKNNVISSVEVITYRESRGGKVQSKRFTNQYQNINNKSNLIKEIDSISGATLSVNAINKQVQLALYLDSFVKK